MARNFVAASAQYLRNAAAVISAAPFTAACWYRPTTLQQNELISIAVNGATNNHFSIACQAAGQIQANARDTAAAQSVTTGILVAGTWAHCGAVFASTTSRTAYLNGVAATVDTTSVNPAGMNETLIGTGENNSKRANGDIAEAAIWNVALSTTDMLALAAGVCPLLIRPNALVFYSPLQGQASPEPDFRGRFDMTLNASPVYAVHPRIFYADGLLIRGVAATGITFDQAGNSGFQTASADYTGNRTVAAGSNRCLTYKVVILGTPGTTVTAITDDNAGTPVAATLIGRASSSTGAGIVEFWRVVAPLVGTAQYRVQLSGAVTSCLLYASYQNVHQTSPTANFNSAQATNGVGAADATVTITTAATGSWVVAGIATTDATGITAGQTSRNNVNAAGSAGAAGDEDTNALVAPGTTAMTYPAIDGLAVWVIGGFELRPVTAPSLAGSLYRTTNLDGLSAGGSFFSSPLG